MLSSTAILSFRLRLKEPAPTGGCSNSRPRRNPLERVSMSINKPQTRICKNCHTPKNIDDFPTYKAGNSAGHRHTCKLCWAERWNPVWLSHVNRYYHENRNGLRDRYKAAAIARHNADPATTARRVAAYEQRHPERALARRILQAAVRSGRIIRQPCVFCGKRSDAHHDDYSRPLDVIWLCRFHHGERHRLLHRYGPQDEWPAEIFKAHAVQSDNLAHPNTTPGMSS